jgi:hypothetical protein
MVSTERSYLPGDFVEYEERGAVIKARVLENISDDSQLRYILEVENMISVGTLGELPRGHKFEVSKPYAGTGAGLFSIDEFRN